jgi:hypothetical protein
MRSHFRRSVIPRHIHQKRRDTRPVRLIADDVTIHAHRFASEESADEIWLLQRSARRNITRYGDMRRAADMAKVAAAACLCAKEARRYGAKAKRYAASARREAEARWARQQPAVSFH